MEAVDRLKSDTWTPIKGIAKLKPGVARGTPQHPNSNQFKPRLEIHWLFVDLMEYFGSPEYKGEHPGGLSPAKLIAVKLHRCTSSICQYKTLAKTRRDIPPEIRKLLYNLYNYRIKGFGTSEYKARYEAVSEGVKSSILDQKEAGGIKTSVDTISSNMDNFNESILG